MPVYISNNQMVALFKNYLTYTVTYECCRIFTKYFQEIIPNVRICHEWKETSFEVGCPEAINIINAVENSRCTLVFITQIYLKSDWNRLQLFVALLRTLHERRRRLIVVRLENVSAFEVVPNGWRELANWLDSMPTLYWSISNFKQTEILEELLDCLRTNDHIGCSHIINRLKNNKQSSRSLIEQQNDFI